MSHNSNNPILWPFAVNEDLVSEVNVTHARMQGFIDGSSDSEALRQVRLSQYAMAVSRLNMAIKVVRDLQETTIDNAYANQPCEELDALKGELGIADKPIDR